MLPFPILPHDYSHQGAPSSSTDLSQLAWILRALSTSSKTMLSLLLLTLTACQKGTAQIVPEKQPFLFLVQSSINILFFFPPPQDRATKTGKTHTQGQPSILPAQGGEQSKLKYNFSSSLHVFQDDLGCPQNNYGFASATPNRKFWVRA